MIFLFVTSVGCTLSLYSLIYELTLVWHTQMLIRKVNFGRFVIQISTAPRESELVVCDGKATISMPQKARLEKFLRELVAKTIKNSWISMIDHSTAVDMQVANQSKCSLVDLSNRRIVKGEYIHSKLNVASTNTGSPKLKSNKKLPVAATSSPFADAFLDTLRSSRFEKKEVRNVHTPPEISFEDAFLDDLPDLNNNKSRDIADGDDTIITDASSAKWTKKRVKALETTIATIIPKATTGASHGSVSLTKDMLDNAEVIAQVEGKFIIVKTGCGKLLCVDQHAADERVALEKLENALFCPGSHDGTKISMTKKQLLVSDILKPFKVAPSKRVALTLSQMATVKHHFALLQKWKFTFEEPRNADKSIVLTGTPSVCGRVADENDLLHFLTALGHFTGGEVKPEFVKKILASQACRYAIMFGDLLTHEQCTNLIKSLAKCNFCFICAHGRPSIIPLIDMHDSCKNHQTAPSNKNHLKRRREMNLTSGPKRFIRSLDAN